MKKIKILYITYDGLTDPLGQSQILPYLTKIANKNVYIDILSFEKKITFSSTTKKVKDKISSSNITWIHQFYLKRPPVISTIIDLIKAYSITKNLFRNRDYNIVHCRGYIPGILGLNLKKNNNLKLVFDMRGWWADEKYESGNWKSPIFKVIYKYFKAKEIQLFKIADIIISLTHVGKNEIIGNNWANPNKIRVIPTCVDFDNFPKFSEKIRKNIRRKLSINHDSKVLVYSGSLGGNYDIKEFSLIFKNFINLSKLNRVLIVSKTPKKFILQKLTETKLDASRVIIVESEFSDVYKYLQASDVGLILYKRAFSTIGRSPTKLGEYWASGIPALSFKGIGDLDFIYKKYPHGLELLEELNDNNLQKNLISLFSKVSTEYLRNAAKEYFHIDKGINFYTNIYKELIK